MAGPKSIFDECKLWCVAGPKALEHAEMIASKACNGQAHADHWPLGSMGETESIVVCWHAQSLIGH